MVGMSDHRHEAGSTKPAPMRIKKLTASPEWLKASETYGHSYIGDMKVTPAQMKVLEKIVALNLFLYFDPIFKHYNLQKGIDRVSNTLGNFDHTEDVIREFAKCAESAREIAPESLSENANGSALMDHLLNKGCKKDLALITDVNYMELVCRLYLSEILNIKKVTDAENSSFAIEVYRHCTKEPFSGLAQDLDMYKGQTRSALRNG